MFEDVIGNLRQSKMQFDSKIKDSFGRSIDDTLFEPAENEVHKLETAHRESEMKIAEIRAITAELRTII